MNEDATRALEGARQEVVRSRPDMLGLFDKHTSGKDWSAALSLADSEHRLFWCLEMLGAVDESDRPRLLAETISTSDCPYRARDGLSLWLEHFADEGVKLFDSERARRRYHDLGDPLTLFRGTVQEEVKRGEWGFSWTLDEARAEWFAAEHGRFRNRSSPAVVLTVSVDKKFISGMATERGEDEIFIHSPDIPGFEPVARSATP